MADTNNPKNLTELQFKNMNNLHGTANCSNCRHEQWHGAKEYCFHKDLEEGEHFRIYEDSNCVCKKHEF